MVDAGKPGLTEGDRIGSPWPERPAAGGGRSGRRSGRLYWEPVALAGPPPEAAGAGDAVGDCIGSPWPWPDRRRRRLERGTQWATVLGARGLSGPPSEAA
jgi:hypothetical protein